MNKSRRWWFSCEAFTCLVVSNEDNLVTVKSAPIVRRFVGQHIKNLANWCRRLGGFEWVEYCVDNDGCIMIKQIEAQRDDGKGIIRT